jgi:hypothetical protein
MECLVALSCGVVGGILAEFSRYGGEHTILHTGVSVIACTGACMWTINLTKELQKCGRKKDAATVTTFDGNDGDITVSSTIPLPLPLPVLAECTKCASSLSSSSFREKQDHDDEDAKFSMADI